MKRMKKGKTMRLDGGEQARMPRLPVLIALAFCIVYAVQLGILQPEMHFQKASLIVDGTETAADAYAAEGSVLFKVPRAANVDVNAFFDGRGSASSLSFGVEGTGMNVTEITVDGKTACSPCMPGKKYAVSAHGGVAVGILAQEAPIIMEGREGMLRRAFFEKNLKTTVDLLVSIDFRGGWASLPNSAIPSSFYGVDAPFHIHRVPIGASHVSRLEWPWAEYTFVSILPASAIYALFGVSHQYAYKIWEILLFFAPVVVFYLFSRKLKRGNDAIFLLASLLYLCLPSQGMVMGGGADLFMYGMTAHTLATSLSLVCLLFAYEFVVERKNQGFWLSILFCALAVASNQRIAVSLFIGLGALAALSLVLSGVKRVVLLGVACAVLCALLVAPMVLVSPLGNYSVLGGASMESIGWAVVGFFQLGYYILPLLFLAGVASAFLRREMFLVFLLAGCVLVFAIATSLELNSLAPFLDGLRFMPSFFLPVFFLSGVGALAALEALFAVWAEKIGNRLKLDRLDCVASFAFAILLPLAALLISIQLTAADQYSGEADSLVVAAEYLEMQQVYGIIGGECVFFTGRGDISQYPIFEQGLERTAVTSLVFPHELASAMENASCRYLILGNAGWITSEEGTPHWQEYGALAQSGLFEEIPYGGSSRLFVLLNATPAAKVEGDGARIDDCWFDYDRGGVKGKSLADECSIRIRNDELPRALECSGFDGCKIRRGTNVIWIDGVPSGEFEILLAPQPAGWFYPLAAVCTAVVLACGYVATRMEN